MLNLAGTAAAVPPADLSGERAPSAHRPARSRLFLGMAALGVAVALVGFAKTFFHPLLTGTFRAPPIVYVHGALLFGWVGFFFAQALLVARRRHGLHRRLGWAGGALAAGVVASTVAIGIYAARRTAGTGAADAAAGELFVVMIEMTIFAALVGAGLALRRRPAIHKRLMLLALIASLGPAWFRFRHYFPEIGNPLFVYSILLADSLIVIAAATDYLRDRHIHPVYLAVGTPMVIVHLTEVFLFDSAGFKALASIFAKPWL